MKIDARILGLLAGTAITASACGGGVQTLEGGSASTASSTSGTTSGTTSTSNGSNTNVATSEGSTSTTEGDGSGTTSVSVSPIPPEDYPPPCGRG